MSASTLQQLDDWFHVANGDEALRDSALPIAMAAARFAKHQPDAEMRPALGAMLGSQAAREDLKLRPMQVLPLFQGQLAFGGFALEHVGVDPASLQLSVAETSLNMAAAGVREDSATWATTLDVVHFVAEIGGYVHLDPLGADRLAAERARYEAGKLKADAESAMLRQYGGGPSP